MFVGVVLVLLSFYVCGCGNPIIIQMLVLLSFYVCGRGVSFVVILCLGGVSFVVILCWWVWC